MLIQYAQVIVMYIVLYVVMYNYIEAQYEL